MKKLSILLCTLLASLAAAQTDLSLPAGTALKVKLETTLTTFSNKPGDPFSARITEPVLLDGTTPPTGPREPLQNLHL